MCAILQLFIFKNKYGDSKIMSDIKQHTPFRVSFANDKKM